MPSRTLMYVVGIISGAISAVLLIGSFYLYIWDRETYIYWYLLPVRHPWFMISCMVLGAVGLVWRGIDYFKSIGE